jgi:hypothetical protein
MPTPFVPVEERFWRHVDVPDDRQACWRWTGHRSGLGYGLMTRPGAGNGRFHAHRVAYEIHKGPIPEGLVIDHLCRNPWCVNPLHLEAVTNAENIRRGNDGTCRRGHPRTPANTHINRNGHRACRRCHADVALRRYYTSGERERRIEKRRAAKGLVLRVPEGRAA